MKVFRINFEKKLSNFKLIPVFDLHLGSIFCQKNLWRKVKHLIKNDDDCYFYIGGDLLEFIPLSDKRFQASNYEQDFLQNADRLLSYSIEVACEELYDIKDKCLFIHGGNHETCYLIKYGIDAISTIAKELGIKNFTSNHECLVSFYFLTSKVETFSIYSHHGIGSSMRGGTLLNRVEDLSISFDANLYIMGHSHQSGFVYKPFFYLDSRGKKLKVKHRYFLRVGGFRNSRQLGIMGYEERMGYRPNGIGTFMIIPYIEWNKNSHLNQINFKIETFL